MTQVLPGAGLYVALSIFVNGIACDLLEGNKLFLNQNKSEKFSQAVGKFAIFQNKLLLICSIKLQIRFVQAVKAFM